MNTHRIHFTAAGILLAAVGTAFGQPPVITQQPLSCSNCIGTIATFNVIATSTGALVYQRQTLSVSWVIAVAFPEGEATLQQQAATARGQNLRKPVLF